MPSSTSVSAQLERKYALSDPFTPLKAHTTIYPKTKVSRDANNRDTHFATSQMAWSPDGTWLVACGDRGMICVFHRDKSVVNGVPAKNGDVVGGGLKS
jgi:polycomb protein EED